MAIFPKDHAGLVSLEHVGFIELLGVCLEIKIEISLI